MHGLNKSPWRSSGSEKWGMQFFHVFLFSLLVLLFFLIHVCSGVSSAAAAVNEEGRLSIILIDGEDLYVRSGDSHTFYQGYELYVKGADADASRVWLELRREGVSLEDTIATEGTSLVYSRNSTVFLNITVDTIYAGTDGALVRFFPVYQYLDPKYPKPQTPTSPLYESSENNSSLPSGPEYQAKGFNASIFFLSLGSLLFFIGIFAGRTKELK
ncbi:S-layer protein domain-containing protein [Methanosarcina sp. Mfa9]|uniref:S-layer protein domain-containing protein n=1 Tax=Methanosarcina sp. Mfa9 TaxID=3439063 RepID=UPI003F8400B2